MIDDDFFYDLFAKEVQQRGRDAARARWAGQGALPEDRIDAFLDRYDENVRRIHEGGPAIIAVREHRSWYGGPGADDRAWPALVGKLEEIGRGGQIESLDAASSKVVAETPDPNGGPRSARGLVVGFVQSGKTTNFTAVAAKLADLDYKAVIVLAGIHNALRKQTQQRLREQLVDLNPEMWYTATTDDEDFYARGSLAAHLTASGKTTLIVAKKNHKVLRRLLAAFKEPSAKQALSDANILVIDDEADQASVESRTINPLIRDLLREMPRATYIGYTATPFANVFIDPASSDDLYPRDFILNLPKPDAYFGPEKIFGRTDASPDHDDVDGYDMIREIPEEDEFLLRPRSKKDEADFVPVITDEVRAAVRWFLLATAARFRRGQVEHSSMLVHTSFKTRVHEAFRKPLESLVVETREKLAAGDETLLSELRDLWESETKRVPGELFDRESETFDEVLEELPFVLDQVVVVIDNSASEDRLVYPEDAAAVAIAVGGNTLSRGLTLEGLVSSLFIRPGNTYDTLLQMGRWFGFRIGYEDLPRIWTTPTLRESFRHLSMVEHEMRSDIEAYQIRNQTPLDMAVRIRTHPALRITAKMGAAVPARTSYSGARLQTRYFEHLDEEWLERNRHAAERLIANVRRNASPEAAGGDIVFHDVPVAAVQEFLDEYSIHPDSSDMETTLIRRYIESRIDRDTPELTRWNVAVIGGGGPETEFAGLTTRLNVRSRLKESGASESGGRADIKTLMSKEDMVVDLGSIDQTSAKKAREAELKVARQKDPQYAGHGLLVLYPIDPASEPTAARRKNRDPLGAVSMPVGLAIVFPVTADDGSDSGSVRTTHVAVELPDDREMIDTDPEIYGTDDE